jgi:hypothetical protein
MSSLTDDDLIKKLSEISINIKKEKDFSNMTKENMLELLDELVEETDIRNKEFQEFLVNKNKIEEKELENFSKNYKDLYPNLLDPLFNIKILQKREFNNLIYNKDIQDVNIEGDNLCNSKFELSLHQKFVRNYLSFLTPYNNLLLYHGLGTGKTCSAIGVCEEMRKYMKQLGIKKKILIIASPNVQENFKLQLFDDRKLIKKGELWDLKGCIGNEFLKEINPTNIQSINKDVLVKLIRKLIKQYYTFMGYEQFSNYISKIKKNIIQSSKESINVKRKIKALNNEFNNRLIVIDEVHNIRSGGFGINKVLEENLLDVVRVTNNLKLLFLSATPMFNSNKEIIWLINLMNLNDKQPQIKMSDIFDKEGTLKKEGKELLIKKSRGYISFIRGENPYSFPYRIYPSLFNNKHSINNESYINPRYQINNLIIDKPLKLVDVYLCNNINNYQKIIYEKSLENIISSIDEVRNIDNEYGLGWQQIDKPLQCLNIVYPNENVDEFINNNTYELNIEDTIGSNGLKNIMNYDKNKTNYNYKSDILNKYGNIFNLDNLYKYSHKISNIIENIKKSKGVVLVYSQYIDGGCIPVALALEELGITRYGTRKSLFEEKPVPNIDFETFKNKEETLKEKSTFKSAKYIMITGDKSLSPKNVLELKAATNENNINGEEVKVIIISKAGSEGIDFKFIRQIHILEPWYNMSRIEQIIGRGVRFCSHKLLPFVERNVEIYLYCTKPYNEFEPLDMYVYRNAEQKAIEIGKISRILKQNAVDCLININYNDLNEKKMNQNVKQNLSNGKTIDYSVGDKSESIICDYMEKCDYKCFPENIDTSNLEIINTTNDIDYILFNIEILINKIKELFNEKYILTKDEIINELKKTKSYPLIQINYALDILIKDNNEFLKDKLNRTGKLVNIGEYYMFQPIELNNKYISEFERKYPIDYKINKLNIKLPYEINENFLIKKEKIITTKEESSIESSIDTPSKTINKITLTKKIKSNIDKYIEDLYDYYNLINEFNSKSNEWYENIEYVKRILLSEDYKGTKIFPVDKIDKYVLEHMIDSIENNKLKEIIIYLYNYKFNKTSINDYEIFKSNILKYINRVYKLDSSNKHKGFIFINNKIKELYILKNNNEKFYLEKIITNTNKEFITQLKLYNLYDVYNTKIYSIDKLNNIIGFMSSVGSYNTIKVKNLNLKGNKGARIEQAIKKKLNDLYNDSFEEINKEKLFNNKGKIKVKLIHLRIIIELLLRYYEDNKINNKKWLITYYESIINNIENINK